MHDWEHAADQTQTDLAEASERDNQPIHESEANSLVVLARVAFNYLGSGLLELDTPLQ